MDQKGKPTIVVDVLTWDYQKAFPVGYFDVIFACPPCEQVSQARTTAPRDTAHAERLVEPGYGHCEVFQAETMFFGEP